MTRPLIVIGIFIAVAAASVVVGASSQDAAYVVGSASTPYPVGIEDEGSGPEGPAVYMALKESSGEELTTEMFERAMQQAAAMPVSTGTWKDLGPTNIGGRITDLVVDSSRPDTIFVAAAGGGIWKSTDAGSTFVTAWPDGSVQAIGALARGSNGTLWAGTGEANPPGGGLTYFGNGIYSSTDGGQNWQFRGLADSGSFGRIVVDPTNPNRIFAAAAGTISTSVTQRGIYRSVDGGATWQQVLAPPNATTGGVDIAIDPSNPNRIFASLWDHKRNNGARTYGGVGSGLFRSTDGGNTWTRLENIVGPLATYDSAATGLRSSPTLGRIGVAIAPSNPLHVYVVFGNQTGADKGFYFSNDGGDSFVAGGQAGGSSGFEWWFGRLWVDPVNENHVFNADVSLRESFTGGAAWAPVTGPHADQHAMAWDPNVANRVYLGNDGGVYRSDLNGASWTHATYEPWNQGYHLAVAADDPLRIAIGLQDNGSNRTWTNAASTPSEPLSFNSYGGGDGHYVAIDQTNHNFYYQCSQGGACGGRSDTATASSTMSFGSKHGVRWTTDAPLAIDPNDPLVIYVGGEVLDRSTNRGAAFTQISPGGANDLPGPIPPEEQDTGLYANLYGAITAIGLGKDPAPGSVPPSDYAQTIYAGTDTGFVWKTSNAGGTWTKLTPNGLPTRWVNGIAVDPTDASHAYVIFSGYREGDNAANIWETKDGGSSWTNISANLPNAPLDSVVLDRPDNLVIVSGDLGVFFLRNPPNLPPTTTWSKLGTNLPNTSVQDIKIQASTNSLYAMTFGRGVQRIALPTDSTAPITTAQLSPPPVNGWYVNPTVTLEATDGTGDGVYKTEYRLDGGDWTTYTQPFQVSGDGSHTLGFRSTDQAGNQEAPGTLTFQIDATQPAIAITSPADGGSYPKGSVVTASYTCTDATSGVDSCSGSVANGQPLDTTVMGQHTFTVTARDQAGNERTRTVTYTVGFAFSGFFTPLANPPTVNVVKAGSAVPVKFSLGGNQGLGIFAAGYPQSQAISCTQAQTNSVAQKDTVKTSSSSLSYDQRTGQYTYNWKTDSGWVNSCRQFTLKLTDASVHNALFKFTK